MIGETTIEKSKFRANGRMPGIIIWVPILAAFTLSAVIVGFYFTQFNNGLSNDQTIWGVFGDYVGGILNPIVGLITIILLVVTLRQNQRALHQNEIALEQNREELELSRVELRNSATALQEQAGHMKSNSIKESLYRSIQLAYEDLMRIGSQNIQLGSSAMPGPLSVALRANAIKEIKLYYDSVEYPITCITIDEYLIVLSQLRIMLVEMEKHTGNDSLSFYFKSRLFVYTSKLYHGDFLHGDDADFYVPDEFHGDN